MDASTEGRAISLHLNVAQREPLKEVETAKFVEYLGIEGDHHATLRQER